MLVLRRPSKDEYMPPTTEWWSPIAQALGLSSAAIALIGSIVILIRKVWQGVKVADARAEGAVGSFDQLYKLLDDKDETIKSLREDLTVMSQRLDTAYKERNEAVSQIGALQVKVEFLIKQVEHLQTQLDVINAKPPQPPALPSSG